MEHLLSKDGTRIAYEQKGQGPPLVLVHGTGIDHSYWDPVAPELERHFTLYIPDRRGRGRSGDVQPYAIEREFEDVAALIESIPENVFLVGHSYGALCSLEAAMLTPRIRKMVLNEPAMYTTVEVSYPADAPTRFLDHLAAGELEEALLVVYEASGVSADELALRRSLPNWPVRIAAVPTLPREILSVRSYIFEPSRFKDLRVPVLLLQGGESDPVYSAAIEAVHAALPNSRLVVLPGQSHDAVITAPGTFVQQLTDFLLEKV